jgi:hypothetical protein
MRRSALRCNFLLVLAVLVLSAAGRVWAAGQVNAEISITQYWELVDQSRQTSAGLKGQSAEKGRAGLDNLALQWEVVKQVRLENGEGIPLDNSFIVTALRAEVPDPDRLTEMFDALLAARRDYPAAQFTAKDIQPLNEILVRPEFQWKEQAPNPINDWFQKLVNRFFAWLDKLFPNREVTAQVGSGPGWSLASTLAVILLALILAYVFRGLFADLITDARLNGDGDSGDEILTADAAFQRAQSLSRGGEYRSAVRYLYLSSLLLLDERGLLRYDRTRTNREYLRTISDSPELAQPLTEVIEVFDNVWYGYHELDESSFKHYSNLVEELKEKKQ